MSMLKKGAHDPDQVWFMRICVCVFGGASSLYLVQIENPSKGFASLEERYGDMSNIAIVTIASELDGALDAIKGLKSMFTRRVWADGDRHCLETLAGAMVAWKRDLC